MRRLESVAILILYYLIKWFTLVPGYGWLTDYGYRLRLVYFLFFIQAVIGWASRVWLDGVTVDTHLHLL